MKQLKRTPIMRLEVLIRILIIVMTALIVYYSKHNEREIINLIGFFIAFVISIFLYKHFFPILTGSLFFYLIASLQEYWNPTYTTLPITLFYWNFADVLLIVGIIDFAWKMNFKYKICDE